MVTISRGIVQIAITIILIGIYFITNGWIFLVLALLVLIFSLITTISEQHTRTREIQFWNVKKATQSNRRQEIKKFNYSFNVSSPKSSTNELNPSNLYLIDFGRKNHPNNLLTSFSQDRKIGITCSRIKPESYLGNVPRVVFKVPLSKSNKPATVKIKPNFDFKTHLKLNELENREKSTLIAPIIDRSQIDKKNSTPKEDEHREGIIQALKERKRSHTEELNVGSSKKKRKDDTSDTTEPMEEEEDDDDLEEDDEDDDFLLEDEDDEDLLEETLKSLTQDRYIEKTENKPNFHISGKYCKKNGFQFQGVKSPPNNEILSSYSSIRKTVSSNPIKRKKSPNQEELAAKISKTTVITQIKDNGREEEMSFEIDTKREEDKEKGAKGVISQSITTKEESTSSINENINPFKSPYLHTIEEHERDMKRTQQRLGHFLKALSSIDGGETSKAKEKE